MESHGIHANQMRMDVSPPKKVQLPEEFPIADSDIEDLDARLGAAAAAAASSRRGPRQERLEAQMVAVTETLKVMMEELKLMKEAMKKEEAPTAPTPSGPPTHGPDIQPEDPLQMPAQDLWRPAGDVKTAGPPDEQPGGAAPLFRHRNS